jgi:DNA-binding transcriptional MerR regulator
VSDARERLTVDELAHRSGLTTRTIRAHQSAGLLPGPRLDGRIGCYGPDHLRRLAVITRLQRRGYSLAAIADLLTAWDDGRTLSEVLGLEPVPAAGDWADELFATYVVPTDPAALLPSPLAN